MKRLGVILLLVGLGLIYGPAWFAVKLSGEELTEATVYSRSSGVWVPGDVTLSQDQSPVAVRLRGFFLPGSAYFGTGIPLKVKVDGPGGVVLEQEVALSTSRGRVGREEGGREVREREDGTVLLATTTGSFEVTQTGEYRITVLPGEDDVDFSLSRVQFVPIAGVSAPQLDLTTPGTVLAFIGAALVVVGMRGRGRKRAKRREKWERETGKIDKPFSGSTSSKSPWGEKAEAPEAKPEPKPAKKKPTIQWGRGDRDER